MSIHDRMRWTPVRRTVIPARPIVCAKMLIQWLEHRSIVENRVHFSVAML
jgi:hypothetical protein